MWVSATLWRVIILPNLAISANFFWLIMCVLDTELLDGCILPEKSHSVWQHFWTKFTIARAALCTISVNITDVNAHKDEHAPSPFTNITKIWTAKNIKKNLCTCYRAETFSAHPLNCESLPNYTMRLITIILSFYKKAQTINTQI